MLSYGWCRSEWRSPLTIFTLTTGTPAERRVIRRALKDFRAVSGYRVVARKNGPRCRQIIIDHSAFPPQDGDHLGYHLRGERSNVIALRPGLTPSALYEVFAHELGHYYGLSHRKTGLMAPQGGERTWGKLTVALRQRVAGELAHLIVATNTRNLY